MEVSSTTAPHNTEATHPWTRLDGPQEVRGEEEGEAPPIQGEEAVPASECSNAPSAAPLAEHSPAGAEECAPPPTSNDESASSTEHLVVNVPSTATECIICYEPLSTSTTSTLECGHAFHASCVEEWLDKDGRCPVCRHQIREVVPPQPDGEGLSIELGTGEASQRISTWQLAALLLSSRRLMSLAAIEALFSIVVMSYARDAVMPLLMLLVRQLACARPLLARSCGTCSHSAR